MGAGIIIPIICARALTLWVLIHLVFAVLPLAAGEPFGSISVSPPGVVVLVCILGLIDVRRRGERILWANLGMSLTGICGLYAMTAIPAEIIFALVFR